METRTQRKNQATVEAILEAAQTLMTEGGMDAVTLEAVAGRADVAVQTVYNRVGGRPALLLAVAQRALRANRGYLDAAYRGQGPVMRRIKGVAAAYVHFAAERPNEFQLLAFPPAAVPAQEQGHGLLSEHLGMLTDLIQQGISDGDFDPRLNPRMTAIALWRLYDGVLALAFRTDLARMPLDELPALLGVVEILVENGLRGAASPTASAT